LIGLETQFVGTGNEMVNRRLALVVAVVLGAKS
jgi:hypothetical protein